MSEFALVSVADDAQESVGVVHYGLGPIGLEVARLAGERPALRSVAALDIDPEVAGRDLGVLVGGAPNGVRVTSDHAAALAASGARIAAHCTGSSLATILPQLLACVEAGLSVVSTCEELSYPWEAQPELARRLDQAARRHGVAVLGTGVNPGFAMDYLPVVLSGASRRVDSVSVRRVQDAGVRRIPLQRKVGAGLSVAEFEERVSQGSVRHVGLPESAHAVAAAFGWQLTELRDEIGPILAERVTASGLGRIPAGVVAGVRQSATGYRGGRAVVSLTLEMAVGLPDPRDEIALEGDPAVRMVIPGGLHGDVATAAVVVNAIGRLLEARPGLRVMSELPPPHP